MCNPTFSSTTNRITSSGYTFDANGNTTADPSGQTFVYDAENKQVSAANGSGTLGEYSYDGDGKRVKKYVPSTGEVTVFAYDAAGKLIAEYSTQLSQTQQVNYLTSDHLGSPRINTDQNGAIAARHDYHPFGEEIDGVGGRTAGLNYGTDTIRKQFTGYERDDESGFDFAEARMYSSKLGRYLSPDPLFFVPERVFSPQQFNAYVYVGNNPLTSVDPDGERPLPLGKKAVTNLKNKVKEIKKQLNEDKGNQGLKDQLAQAKADLKATREGNRVVSAWIKALNHRGEGEGYKVEDFSISTEPVADMKQATEEYNNANPTAPISVDLTVSLVSLQGTNALTIGTSIYIFTDRDYYRQSLLLLNGQTLEGSGLGLVGKTDGLATFATGLSHEKKHAADKKFTEKDAYEFQLQVLTNMNNVKAFKNQKFVGYYKSHLTTCRDTNGDC
ncbi:MAG: RHS repeat-associated core domain-containing protein [Acidobacteria bacterium ACB1]|nr:hypothetical protein [Pyrinomonadaceae bacterium]MCE7962576.1 RHS repeat-associated core domain-containing protein [Acidobacteria bacterium ACB1]RIJ94216.1 MAG: hypothetical protein DCC44_05110 [Acidobacteriota bacterium]